MRSSGPNQNRIEDKTKLLLKFNYVSSFLSLVLGLFCVFLFEIKGTISFVFFFYPVMNLLNVGAFTKHHNLTAMAIYTTLLSWVSTLAITLSSGGINSPFIFILAIIVLAGYIATRFFGNIYMYAILLTIITIFFINYYYSDFIENEVPQESREMFGLASILFAVYLMGWIFGKDLMNAHYKLYKSKEEIERRIDEKENLLREVHHRVKNNLQTVSSLLSLQAKNTKNEQIKNVVNSSQTRVMSMAMIHEMLYMRNNLSKIQFKSYVNELTEYLVSSIKEKEIDITINIDIPDVQLGIDTAIPLGLLINETLTNSIKYAFEDNSKGQIDIVLRKEKNTDSYSLQICDNGIGFSQDIDFKSADSLGIKLIHNLARQLKGSAKRISTPKGTKYEILFQDINKTKKHRSDFRSHFA
ncbi:sensor histidine kinase [Pareuzebyella sediminis]|uniref:sensor histidine kinase n=1 Tax=Pareuzebyella sediminis TaxID=2607998 RepID=UPI0011EF5927|nr:sensor histidine kinase [Pareuzebyella sediminis]